MHATCVASIIRRDTRLTPRIQLALIGDTHTMIVTCTDLHHDFARKCCNLFRVFISSGGTVSTYGVGGGGVATTLNEEQER